MRIETLLEAKAKADDVNHKAILAGQQVIRDDVKAIRKEFDDHKADYSALKNKGTGILVGVALAAGGLGAGISQFVSWIK